MLPGELLTVAMHDLPVKVLKPGALISGNGSTLTITASIDPDPPRSRGRRATAAPLPRARARREGGEQRCTSGPRRRCRVAAQAAAIRVDHDGTGYRPLWIGNCRGGLLSRGGPPRPPRAGGAAATPSPPTAPDLPDLRSTTRSVAALRSRT